LTDETQDSSLKGEWEVYVKGESTSAESLLYIELLQAHA